MSNNNIDAVSLPELTLTINGGGTLKVNVAVPNVNALDVCGIAPVTASSGTWVTYKINYTGTSNVINPQTECNSEPESECESDLSPRPSVTSLWKRIYDHLPMVAWIFGSDVCTVLSVKPFVGQIILYSGTDYSGDSLILNESAITLVGSPYHFNDRTRSIRVLSGRWKLWTNTNFQGQSQIRNGPSADSTMSTGAVSSVELIP
jgi:hypothetical protein